MHPSKTSLRQLLLHELPRKLIDIDDKLLRTLRYLVTRPGFLAAEYIAGRRNRYIGPFRLYLLVFALHALIQAMSPHHDLLLSERIARVYVMDMRRAAASQNSPPAYWNTPATRERIEERSRWASEGGIMLIFLLVALAQQLIFLRQRRGYLEHAVLAMSVTTFYVLLISVAEIVLDIVGSSASGQFAEVLSRSLGVALFVVYWVFAIRRYYGIGWLPSAAGAILVSAVQVVAAINLSSVILWALIVTA